MIVGGGELRAEFLKEYAAQNEFDLYIAADCGLDVMKSAGILPTIILGDYDSLSSEKLLEDMSARGIPIETYPCEKDFSDTESAIRAAIARGSTEITLLGMCGGRLDHFLANVMSLRLALEAGVSAGIVDEQNEIFLADHSFELHKGNEGFRFISFIPLEPKIEGITLKGFKYSRNQLTLTQRQASLAISNEITGETASVEFSGGTIAVIRSRDRQ